MRGPDQGAVLHLARRPGGLAFLVGALEHAVHLLHLGQDARVDAAVHLIVPFAEELVAGSDELGAGGAVDLPLLQFEVGLLIEAAHAFEIMLPVPFGAGGVLDGADAGPDVLGAHLDGLLIQVADREAEVEDRDVREAAGEVARGHGGAVAGHGAGDEERAHVGQRVDDQGAALGGRDRAGVGGQAVALDRVDVGDADQLVDLGDEEHGQELVRDGQQVREARGDLAHGHLVEGEEHFVELVAVAVLAVGLGEEDQILGHVAEDGVGGRVAHAQVRILGHVAEDGVGGRVAHAQVRAAQAHEVLVHEAVAAEVGNHPAVPQGAVQGGDEVLREGREEHAPHARPLEEVVGGVGDAAPLAPDGAHGAFAVEAAEAALAVYDPVPLFGGGEGHEVGEFALDALAVGAEDVQAVAGELLPVGLLQHAGEDAGDLLQVLALLLPVDVVTGLEEFRIGVLQLCHYALPSSLWIRLISSDSTKAWTRVRSWPELPLLYRRSTERTGQPYSSCMMWLTSARSKPQ